MKTKNTVSTEELSSEIKDKQDKQDNLGCREYLQKAQINLLKMDYKKAYEAIKKATKRDYYHHYQTLISAIKAEYLIDIRRYTQADRVIQKHLRSAYIKTASTRDQCALEKQRIRLNVYLGRMQTSLLDCQLWIKNNPSRFEIYPLYLDILYGMGKYLTYSSTLRDVIPKLENTMTKNTVAISADLFNQIALHLLQELEIQSDWNTLSLRASQVYDHPNSTAVSKCQILLVLARTYAKQKRVNKAWHYYNDAAQMAKTISDSYQFRVSLHEGLIDSYLGNYERAIKTLGPQIRKSPHTWENLGFYQALLQCKHSTLEKKMIKDIHKKTLLFSIETNLAKEVIESLKISGKVAASAA